MRYGRELPQDPSIVRADSSDLACTGGSLAATRKPQLLEELVGELELLPATR